MFGKMALGLTMAVLAIGPANASQAIGFHVINVNSNDAGVMTFYIDSARMGAPSCGSSTATAFAIKTSTLAGQAMAASLLTALSAKLFVDAGGTGVCDIRSDVETAGYVSVRY